MHSTATGHRNTQADRLLALLKAHVNQWVELPAVMRAGGAQYGARIYELRRRGHRIESHQVGDRSWFKLVISWSVLPRPKPQPKPANTTESLFGDLTPEPRYPD